MPREPVQHSAASLEPAGPAPRGARAAPLVAVGAVVVLVVAMASIGNPFALGVTVMVLADAVVWAGLPAAAYLLAGIGLGRVLLPLYRGARNPLAMQMALGVGFMLMLSHLLGVLGVLGGISSAAGQIVGGGVLVIGLGLLGQQVVKAQKCHSRRARDPMVWLCAGMGAPALALLMVAASNPPGWLWESEGRGYDALSYHVQLPQEWLVHGWLAPLEHNVYSFLPSYVEAAFYHLGVVMGAGRSAHGLLAGEGHGVLMAQWLHAGVGLLGAVLIAQLVIACAREATGGDAERASRAPLVAGLLAGAMYLSIPWVVVTGSLAYNDLGVVALLAGAIIAAMDRELPAVRRGVVVGLLVGIACGIKPTALLFAGVPAGIALLAFAPPRAWGLLVAAGALAGLAMLAPWLIRNALAAGNPVFPFATSLFGTGHWDAEQAARYAAAHSFDGGLLDRLRLLVMADPDDPAGARHRGLLHPQWSAFPLVALVAAGVAIAHGRTRMIGLVLMGMLAAQLIVWLVATHLQSRFLLPMVVPAAALFGVVVAMWAGRAKLVTAGASAVVLVMLATSVVLFAREPRMEGMGANQMLVPGPSARTGELFRSELERAMPRERRGFLADAGPEVFVKLGLPAGSHVALVGDATPLYYTAPIVYATTWDRSLLARAIMEYPDDQRAWAAYLRGWGVTHLLVNYAELDRLARSGFLDPNLSIERVERFVESHAQPVRLWAEVGMVLYDLRGGGE